MRDDQTTRLTVAMKRAIFTFFVISTTASAAWFMSQVIAGHGLDVIGCAILFLFTLTFGWLAMWFWTAVFGFVAHLAGDPTISLAASDQPLTERVAITMPIYNENTVRVSAGLQAMLTGLTKTSDAAHFDFFILSDTRNADIAVAEEAMIKRLRAQYPAGPQIYYRRRERNIGRKAGNIEDFIRRWGGAYPYMIVLDADSIMSGHALSTLARTMEKNPDIGIIQTLPMPVNRETAFARILQFASRLYGPILFSGLSSWMGDDGIYYGHNAIIRTAAFAKHCGLPILPGRAPLGGEILSHDFVESALISSGGYKVRFATELPGSYEEMPANVIDYAKRDQRWCQGNLQHSRLLSLPVLRPMGRLHLTMGIFSYLTSPLWLALLLLSTLDAVRRTAYVPSYFKPGFNLFPNWPIATDFQVDLLLCMTIVALILPKVMGLALVLRNRRQCRAFGGPFKLCLSAVVEIIFSSLLAPIMMLFQTRFISEALAGRSVIWDAQARDDRGLAWREGLRHHGWHMLIGLTWAGGVYFSAPDFFWWLAPIWLGLMSAVPLSVWSSRSNFGSRLKRRGLFLTPEEIKPPPELRRLRRALRYRHKFRMQSPVVTHAPLVPQENGLMMPRLPWSQQEPLAGEHIQWSVRDAS